MHTSMHTKQSILLVCLQVGKDVALDLRWVCSADEKEADDLSRPKAAECPRLEPTGFDQSWGSCGGFDKDIMATPASCHAVLASSHGIDRHLAFYSRYHASGSFGVS